MKRTLIALSLLAAFSAGACTARDAWTGPDKTKHFVGGAAIGAAVTLATKEPMYGLLAGTAVGALKEVRDSRGHGTCSFQDFAVTALGAAAGAYGSAWLVLPRKDGVFVGYASTF